MRGCVQQFKVFAFCVVILTGFVEASLAQTSAARIDDALQNITTLIRQGSVNDSPAMRAVVVHGCSYTRKVQEAQAGSSTKELIAIYGAHVTSEIQRLRLNNTRRVWIIFDAGIGYVQCMPETPLPTIYCEAQSAES